MASGSNQHQVLVGANQEPEFSLSCHPFTRHFSQPAHALLTSCTRQEVLGFFAPFDPKTQEYLYKVYALVVAQIRENVIAEFGSICKEHQVLEVLDHVSDRTLISILEAGDYIHPEKVAKEVAVTRKSKEIQEMRRKLEQAKEENRALAAQLEHVRLDMEKARDQVSLNDLIEKFCRSATSTSNSWIRSYAATLPVFFVQIHWLSASLTRVMKVFSEFQSSCN